MDEIGPRCAPKAGGKRALLWAVPFLLASVAHAQTGGHSTLRLGDAIRLAQASPGAHEGQDAVDAARGGVVGAGLRPNPRLYLQTEDVRPWARDFDFPNNTEDYGYLGQLFELGGKRRERLGVARAREDQAEAERVLLNQQIAGRVAGAYWTAVANAQIAKLLEEDLRAVDAIVEYNRKRVDAGAMRGIDLIRSEIERDRLRLGLETARREAALARIELFRQMGRKPDPATELIDKLDAAVPIATRGLAAVLADRADVVVAREGVAAAEAEVKLQRALGVPDIDVLGGYKRNSSDNTLYASLQLPLAFRNRNQGEIARAQANAQLAKDRLQALELSVGADVEAAQEDFARQGAIAHDILPDMRARARQNLAIMDDAYRTGGADLLRYLDAERTEFDVEVSALRTLAALQQAGLRLQLTYGVTP